MKKAVLFLCIISIMACSEAVRSGSTPYSTAYESSIRTKKVYVDFETRAIIQVSYFSKEFLDAYMAERKAFMKESQFLQFAEKENVVSEKNIRFFVNFTTPNPDDTDLEKQSSIWQVYLEKADGTKILPAFIKKNTEPKPLQEHFFPVVNAWAGSYFIGFSKTADDKPVIDPGEPFKLVFKSVLGTADFTYTFEK